MSDQIVQLAGKEVTDALNRHIRCAGPSYARLVSDLYVAHNAGRIHVEPGATDIRFGKRN
jgi:hypothetical protein